MRDVPSISPSGECSEPRDIVTRAQRPHLVGVAGTGMNSLATLLRAMGKDVSGSDRAAGSMLAWLAQQGVRTQVGHEPRLVLDADLVIRSAAVSEENAELLAARARDVPILSHARALGALMAARRGVAVAGTHGKSTTTALVAHILAVAGRDPTLVGGAIAPDFGASSHLGAGPELVAEADEYGRRFLELHPGVAVITSVEPDHLDYYGSFEAVVDAFRQFVAGMADDGVAITNADGPVLRGLGLPRRRVTYGADPSADWRLVGYTPRSGGGASLVIGRPDRSSWIVESALTGRHNAMNALAAVAAATELDVPTAAIEKALASFRGTRRRFETRARRDGIWVVDDYAHHPTAVRATLSAARDVHSGRIVVVFQPHTHHRTVMLLDEFAVAFGDADRVILVPIYQPTGREAEAGDVTSFDVIARMVHPDCLAVESLDAAFELLASEELRPGTLVLTLGAGDVTTVADRLAIHLEARAGPELGSGALGTSGTTLWPTDASLGEARR